MYPILETKKLTANIYWMEVKAERIAKSCMPGQFVIVRTDADSERIPLTICDYNREKGTITIVFQPVGASTHLMTSLKAGDAFHDVAGPLGMSVRADKRNKGSLGCKENSVRCRRRRHSTRLSAGKMGCMSRVLQQTLS